MVRLHLSDPRRPDVSTLYNPLPKQLGSVLGVWSRRTTETSVRVTVTELLCYTSFVKRIFILMLMGNRKGPRVGREGVSSTPLLRLYQIR